MMKNINKVLNLTDKSAVVLSFLCIVHCLALPIMLILLPSVAVLAILDNEIFHLSLVFAVVPISLFTIALGYKQHKNASVFVISAVGIMMLIAAVVGGHELLGDIGETLLTAIGSLLVTVGHLRNFKLRRFSQHNKAFAMNTVY